MKRIAIALLLLPLPAVAQVPQEPKTVAISVSLLEEVFRSLSAQPYASVAATIAKLQTEVQQQRAVPMVPPMAGTPGAPPTHEPVPPEPK